VSLEQDVDVVRPVLQQQYRMSSCNVPSGWCRSTEVEVSVVFSSRLIACASAEPLVSAVKLFATTVPLDEHVRHRRVGESRGALAGLVC
jgi:hypothetical protein